MLYPDAIPSPRLAQPQPQVHRNPDDLKEGCEARGASVISKIKKEQASAHLCQALAVSSPGVSISATRSHKSDPKLIPQTPPGLPLASLALGDSPQRKNHNNFGDLNRGKMPGISPKWDLTRTEGLLATHTPPNSHGEITPKGHTIQPEVRATVTVDVNLTPFL